MDKKYKKILVVDDSPISQKITRKFLETSGYEVIEAWDGKDCMNKLNLEIPSAIIMDVILPNINGKDLVGQIKKDPRLKNVPVVFATNTLNLDEDDGNASIEIDGQIYRAFAKPIHSQKLLSVIRKEINRSITGGTLPKAVLTKEKPPKA